MLQLASKKGMVRQAYDAAAFVAVLNLLAILVAAGYLIFSGSIRGDQVRQAIAMLRGQAALHSDSESKPPASLSAKASTSETSAPSTGGIDYSSATELEAARFEAERIKVELDQRMALSNAVLLKVRTEREEYEKEREAAAKQEQTKLANKSDLGEQREVAIYESLAPKIAMEHLLGISDIDEAAKILVTLPPAKARKIVEAAKRGRQLEQMKAILQRVRDVSPAKSSELGESESVAKNEQ